MVFYHNPRCRKSRESLAILQDKGLSIEIREYLKVPLTKKELIVLNKKLGVAAEKMVRKNEPIFKEQFKALDLKEDDYINMMEEYPILMERPVFENGDVAVIGRPPENILSILN